MSCYIDKERNVQLLMLAVPISNLELQARAFAGLFFLVLLFELLLMSAALKLALRRIK